MRILILGAGGRYRTEASIARAAKSLGHTATVVDALGWRRMLGPWSPKVIRWQFDHFQPEFVLCTRRAVSAGEEILRDILPLQPSALWYFDAAEPLPAQVVTLARLVPHVFATYGYQVEAFRKAGAAQSHFLPQGLDLHIDRPDATATPDERCDVSFIGSGQYPRRHAILKALATAVRLQVRGPYWEKSAPELPIAGGPVRGRNFARVVGGATISLGIDALPEQRQETLGGTSNRIWRVLGAGGLFLGEYVEGCESLAKHGEHVLWYRSAEEAVTLAKQYLGDKVGRRRVAAAGRAHALTFHTYGQRLNNILAGEGYRMT
jgi:hypothetical protein